MAGVVEARIFNAGQREGAFKVLVDTRLAEGIALALAALRAAPATRFFNDGKDEGGTQQLGYMMAMGGRGPGVQPKMSLVIPAYQPSASSFVCSRTSALSPTSLIKPSSLAIFSSVAS